MERSADAYESLVARLPGVRWLGLVPIFAYILGVHDFLIINTPDELLWVCNIAALALGLGMVFEMPRLVWGAALCVILGTPLWLLEELVRPEFSLHSLLTHFGGIAVFAVWIYMRGAPQKRVWWLAWLSVPLLQIVARLTTDGTRNINVAFRPYGGAEEFFSSHMMYLITIHILALGGFWVTERVLRNRVRSTHSH